MKIGSDEFRQVWFVDFEYQANDGETPTPWCVVAKELGSGRVVRQWLGDLDRPQVPPFSFGPDILYVAYYAIAEMSCHLALGWSSPSNLLDLFAEFRNVTNGGFARHGSGLLGALAHYGLPGIESLEKDTMRDLAIRGGPFTEVEKSNLLAYCESDVHALDRLYRRMEPGVDLPRALLRGRFMSAAARIEANGVPIDVPSLWRLRQHWSDIQDGLIAEIDRDYGVYDGRTFKLDRFVRYLGDCGIPWPRHESGRLKLDADTFKDAGRLHPEIESLRQLRTSLAQLRLERLAVGRDGRNRTMLSPFRSKTGRNQPSNTRFIFGPSAWMRSLIRPEPGHGLAYIDWSQQEFGIGAALSRDQAMMDAYRSGDPYLGFAVLSGAAPADATKATHGDVRDRFKVTALAVQYGMEAGSLGLRLGITIAEARELLALHRTTFLDYWRFSDAAVDYAMLHNRLWTVFGWNLHAGDGANPRSLRNFPLQANGAEMLRLACIFATEDDVRVAAPVHDALLIEARLEALDDAIARTQAHMAEASRLVLDGFELRTDVKVVKYPDRYMDKRGVTMWNTVMGLMGDGGSRGDPRQLCRGSPDSSVTPDQFSKKVL